MKKLLLAAILLLGAIGVKAQTAQRVIGTPTLPAHCQAGPNPQVYVDTNATATAQFYICTSTNHWTAQGGGGGGEGVWGEITGTLSNQTDLQAALNLKANLASPTFTGTVSIPSPFTLGGVSVLPTGTELNFVDGVTSNIQTQLDAKIPTSRTISTTGPLGGGGALSSNLTLTCTTCATSAAALTSTAVVTGAGSQGLQTPSASTTLDSLGNFNTSGYLATGIGSGVAGNIGLGQGTATGVASTTIQFQAPTSVTGYNFVFPSAAASGLLQWTNSANVMTGTITALTSGRVTFATTNGLLADDSDLTFATDTLTATKIVAPTSLTVAGAAVTNNLVQNSQSTAYTTVLGDAGKSILHPSTDANARTFTIDSNANVAYPVGTCITFINMTANVVTIAITSDTMYLAGTGTTGSRSLAQYGVATAYKIDATHWIISGSGLT